MDIDIDPFEDIFADEALKNARPVGKFKPKAKFRPTKKASTVTSVSISQNIDSTLTDKTEPVENAKPSENVVSRSDAAVHNDNGALMEKSVGDSSDVFIGLEVLDDFPNASSNTDCCPPSEAIDSLTVVDHIHNRELEREELDAMDSVNITELTTNSEKNSVPIFEQDNDVLDLSSLYFAHTSPSEQTSELHLNGESSNHMVDSGIHLQGVPEVPTKLVSRRSKTESSKTRTSTNPFPEEQEASPSNQANRSLRPRKRKTNSCELVDEGEEVEARADISEECPLNNEPFEEENINNGLESESQMKKSKRKSKKPDDDDDIGKPCRKRKKAKEASDAKPKKFSHCTRRKRVVDKVLLQTPEDEIDYQKVPLRDLIVLAEHQEKQKKKDEAVAGAPVTKQSNGNSYNEDDTFISKQDAENNDEQGSPVAEEDTTVFFNYQSYMNKTPTARWSKQDTELFYGAMSQFGTDFSMIQQLFPGRTRRQVKLKYKKEERQHRMRLNDALTNRGTKDHSYFKKVIEMLKQIAAEEKQTSDEDDDPIDLTTNEVVDEGTLNANDEEAEVEDIREQEDYAEETHSVEVQSPLKSDEDEEYDFWSQYKSDP